MPAVTQFIDGTGPVFAGKLFPVRVHHHRVRRGLGLPRAGLERHDAEDADAARPDARLVGYGSMLTESLVGVMAMIAAATLDPGVYFAMNVGPATLGTTAASRPRRRSRSGASSSARSSSTRWPTQMGEATLLSRTGGAPSLAVGMAGILGNVFTRPRPRALVPLRDHVRGGVHPDDDRRRHARRPLHAAGAARPRLRAARPHVVVSEHPALVGRSSSLGWGYFLYQGVVDPLGGINSLWPLFGIANQLLAAVALCVATTVLVEDGEAALRVGARWCRSPGWRRRR